MPAIFRRGIHVTGLVSVAALSFLLGAYTVEVRTARATLGARDSSLRAVQINAPYNPVSFSGPCTFKRDSYVDEFKAGLEIQHAMEIEGRHVIDGELSRLFLEAGLLGRLRRVISGPTELDYKAAREGYLGFLRSTNIRSMRVNYCVQKDP